MTVEKHIVHILSEPFFLKLILKRNTYFLSHILNNIAIILFI